MPTSFVIDLNDLYRWLYLEPILSNDEGELGVKFRKVDQGFRQVTRIFEADPRLSVLLQSARLQPMLDSISEQLLACQSALNKYIDVSNQYTLIKPSQSNLKRTLAMKIDVYTYPY